MVGGAAIAHCKPRDRIRSFSCRHIANVPDRFDIHFVFDNDATQSD